jgi:hypothetical protein
LSIVSYTVKTMIQNPKDCESGLLSITLSVQMYIKNHE